MMLIELHALSSAPLPVLRKRVYEAVVEAAADSLARTRPTPSTISLLLLHRMPPHARPNRSTPTFSISSTSFRFSQTCAASCSAQLYRQGFMLQGQATLSLAAFGIDYTLSSSPTKTARMPIPDLLKGRPASRPGSVIYPSSPLHEQASFQNNAAPPPNSDELMAPPNTAQLFGAGPPRQVSAGSMDSGSTGSGHTKQPSNTSRSAIRDAFKKSTPILVKVVLSSPSRLPSLAVVEAQRPLSDLGPCLLVRSLRLRSAKKHLTALPPCSSALTLVAST